VKEKKERTQIEQNHHIYWLFIHKIVWERFPPIPRNFIVLIAVHFFVGYIPTCLCIHLFTLLLSHICGCSSSRVLSFFSFCAFICSLDFHQHTFLNINNLAVKLPASCWDPFHCCPKAYYRNERIYTDSDNHRQKIPGVVDIDWMWLISIRGISINSAIRVWLKSIRAFFCLFPWLKSIRAVIEINQGGFQSGLFTFNHILDWNDKGKGPGTGLTSICTHSMCSPR